MKCVVTAGPTFEPLDDVRRLINFSTGRLGTELANYLVSCGHNVSLLRGHQATWRGECLAQEVLEFTTTSNLRAHLETLGGRGADAVLHAAAVSDFKFGTIWRRLADGNLEAVQSGKISSRSGPLLAELVATPKIICQLRDWFPRACLIGWKYEVGGGRAEAIAEAERQITASRTDACVANGPAYGSGFGLVAGPKKCAHLEDVGQLYRALEKFLGQHAPGA
jgi:phosphopantothenate---cysteine ligase (CTP)